MPACLPDSVSKCLPVCSPACKAGSRLHWITLLVLFWSWSCKAGGCELGQDEWAPRTGVWYEDSWGLDTFLSWSYLWPPDRGTRGHRGPYRSLLFSSVQRHSYTLHFMHTNSDTRTHSHTRRSMAVVLGISALFREPDHFGSQTALHHTTYTVYNSAKCSLFMIPMRRPVFHINYSIHTISIQK